MTTTRTTPTTFHFKGHTFTITQDEDLTFAFEIDNRIWSGGWAYRSSAIEAAQSRIVEINAFASL